MSFTVGAIRAADTQRPVLLEEMVPRPEYNSGYYPTDLYI